MSPEEIKDQIKLVINSLIKDKQDEAANTFHDVLAAKLQARISPESKDLSTDVNNDDNDNDDNDNDDSVNDDNVNNDNVK